MLQRTPLYESHLRHGGKIVPFAGWELPVQYAGVVAEHVAVRESAGIFDVSHMGEIFVTGPEAEKALNYLTCNNIAAITDGKAQYGAILNERGGIVDDIIVYRFSPERFLVCVNASNADKDYAWFTEHNTFNAVFENRSAEFGQIAVQGPRARELVIAASGVGYLNELKPFHFVEVEMFGAQVYCARTGYTGEDGFELFLPSEQTEVVWEALLKKSGITPCGLGARDSLRLEACLPLHGHELGDDITALESNLAWIVKLAKGDFLGRAALEAQLVQGLPRKLVGFFVDEPGIVRHGDKVLAVGGELPIGFVTSGTKTPTVGRALGLAIVDTPYTKLESVFEVEVRGRRLKAHVVPTPFYRRK